MSTIVDSRDYSRYHGLNAVPQFRAKCPHCGNVNLLSFQDSLTIFGQQGSKVITCSHSYQENSNGSTITYPGCNKRYVVDVRVDVLATSIALPEEEVCK